MEESTGHKTVIGLLKRFRRIKCSFFHFFISFEHDFHVDAEIMIVRTREMSIISANKFDFTTRIFFRREDLSIFIDHMIRK